MIDVVLCVLCFMLHLSIFGTCLPLRSSEVYDEHCHHGLQCDINVDLAMRNGCYPHVV